MSYVVLWSAISSEICVRSKCCQSVCVVRCMARGTWPEYSMNQGGQPNLSFCILPSKVASDTLSEWHRFEIYKVQYDNLH